MLDFIENKEVDIMATDNEYILFLDETDTNESNQYFCLAGFIISRQEYENILIPQIKIEYIKFDSCRFSL